MVAGPAIPSSPASSGESCFFPKRLVRLATSRIRSPQPSPARHILRHCLTTLLTQPLSPSRSVVAAWSDPSCLQSPRRLGVILMGVGVLILIGKNVVDAKATVRQHASLSDLQRTRRRASQSLESLLVTLEGCLRVLPRGTLYHERGIDLIQSIQVEPSQPLPRR